MWLLYLPLVMPALAGAAARPLAARLEPRLATWLLTSATVALAGCSTAALALLAAFAAARTPALAALGHAALPGSPRTTASSSCPARPSRPTRCQAGRAASCSRATCLTAWTRAAGRR